VAAAADGVRVSIPLTPRAAADRVDAIVFDAAGSPVLKVSVTAPPVDNRANESVLQLLAREWRVPRRDLALAAGAKSRSKTVLIRGDAAVLLARLRPALTALPRK
jgi:uncharacterized protein (TIGR00251 family)